MVLDLWGIPFFYPSKPNGFYWTQKDDIKDDSHFDPGDAMTSSGGGSFTIHFSGPTSPDTYSDPAFLNSNSIGGCSMNFEDTAARGYIWKPNDPVNIEFKMIMNVRTLSGGGFSVSGPTGRHSGSGCCSGFSYMFTCEVENNPSDFRFRKEMWHVSYHTDPVTGTWTHPLVNFRVKGHGNVGLGYVRYNKKDGVSVGHDSVIIECWFNPDPDDNPLDWTMLKRTEDKGGWGDDGDKCNGAKDQIGTWGGPKFRIKSNGTGDIDFKRLSLREIDPFATFDDNPTEPPPVDEPPSTTTVQGLFKLQWDINTYRTSLCAPGGGGGGSSAQAIFYTVAATHDKELSDTSTFQNRTRVVEVAANSSSILKTVGKPILQADIPLYKVGSPAATPTVKARIYSSSGSVIYTSPTSLDPSTLTGSFVKKTFDFSTNTHIMQSGEYVGVYYNTDSDSDYVVCGYGDKQIDNCYYANYENGVLEPKQTSRDFACDLWA